MPSLGSRCCPMLQFRSPRSRLPARRAEAAELSAHVTRIVARVAERTGKTASDRSQPPLDLAPLLAQADAHFLAGRIDEAAAVLDATLDNGSRAPERLVDSASF